MAQAQVTAVFMQQGLPIMAKQLYKDNALDLPEPGDVVFIGGAQGGKLGFMAALQKDVGAPPPPPPVPQMALDADGNPVQLPGPAVPEAGADAGGKPPTFGRPFGGGAFGRAAKRDEQAEDEPDGVESTLFSGVPVNRILAVATTDELERLLPVLEAAEAAPHQNGESALLARHLRKIAARAKEDE